MSSKVWCGLGSVIFLVSQEVRAQEEQGLKPEQVHEALQHYVLGQSCSAPGLTSQESAMLDATTSIRGGHEVRLRFFTVKDPEISEPADGFPVSQEVKEHPQTRMQGLSTSTTKH
jgi:hypothetical protein